jgi:SHS2 domain-containing protein
MDMNGPHFITLDHTADLGIEVYGNDLNELFEGAAMAMMRIMVGSVAGPETRGMPISVAGDDLSDLMVRWLGEILYLLEGERKIVSAVTARHVSPRRLDAVWNGMDFDPDRHEILCEIKAVTYHQIAVSQKDGRWQARVIFDV